MPEVGKLSIKIESTGKEQTKKDINEVTETAKSSSEGIGGFLSNLGKGAVALGKTFAVGVGACATAISGLTGMAVNAYGNYEQLVGGVETLFKESSDIIMQYAKNAYETAGMSANEYMTTVTAFTASLLQGLNGDTAKTAEVANMAVTDMADNANKMGTAMESIQNAYQGFSKQNYTMLDNLKLGYGGTKTEMERLLVDAEKLTGIKYDISNLADVYNAIHVIQQNLGITGTTALEASTTIQGSMMMVKSAWINLMTGMTDSEQDITVLVDTFSSSLNTMLNNVTPKVEQVFQTIPNVMTKLVPTLIGMVIGLLPSLIEATTNLVNGLVSAIPSMLKQIADVIPQLGSMIIQVLPQIVESFSQLFGLLYIAFTEGFPQLIDSFGVLMEGIGSKIQESMPSVISKGLDILLQLSQTLLDNVPQLITIGMEFIRNIIIGIVNSLPELIAKVPEIISNLAGAFNESMATIFSIGLQIIWEIAKGVVQAIPDLIAHIPEIINMIFNLWNAINWWNLGSTLISGITNGIKSMGGSLLNSAINLFNNLKTNIFNIFGRIKTIITSPILTAKTKVLALVGEMSGGIGNVFNGIRNVATSAWNGILNAIKNPMTTAKNFVSNIINTIKGFFNFRISWPHIPMPHFSIRPLGWSIGDLLKGKIPSLGISWYAKAMDNPMILDGATIFGASNGRLLGGGESGEEVVSGKKTLLKMIGDVVATYNQMTINQLNERVDRMYELLSELLPQLANSQVVLDTGALVGGLAQPMDGEFGRIMTHKGRGN